MVVEVNDGRGSGADDGSAANDYDGADDDYDSADNDYDGADNDVDEVLVSVCQIHSQALASQGHGRHLTSVTQ